MHANLVKVLALQFCWLYLQNHPRRRLYEWR